jgi:hypothetical protein
MHEFNSRIAAQRAILQVVNQGKWQTEHLFGLSTSAIERWVSNNCIEPTSVLVELVKDAAAKLFFLANKSQDQISDEYRRVSDDIEAIRDAIAIELKTQELLEPRGNS